MAAITADPRQWVNDGLMALFFFLVGLEIKRELVVGELPERRAAALPVVAAVGGVALPAWSSSRARPRAKGRPNGPFPRPPTSRRGRHPGPARKPRSSGVKLFMLTVAIVDDIIAVAIIAVFYSSAISLTWLAGATAALLAVVALQRLGVTRIAIDGLVGVVAWGGDG